MCTDLNFFFCLVLAFIFFESFLCVQPLSNLKFQTSKRKFKNLKKVASNPLMYEVAWFSCSSFYFAKMTISIEVGVRLTQLIALEIWHNKLGWCRISVDSNGSRVVFMQLFSRMLWFSPSNWILERSIASRKGHRTWSDNLWSKA